MGLHNITLQRAAGSLCTHGAVERARYHTLCYLLFPRSSKDLESVDNIFISAKIELILDVFRLARNRN